MSSHTSQKKKHNKAASLSNLNVTELRYSFYALFSVSTNVLFLDVHVVFLQLQNNRLAVPARIKFYPRFFFVESGDILHTSKTKKEETYCVQWSYSPVSFIELCAKNKGFIYPNQPSNGLN